jgi:UDP-glucose 4-epimerase
MSQEAISEIQMVQGDITDFKNLCRTIKLNKVDIVIHLASLQIPASNANPPAAVNIVTGGLVNVLEAARILDLKKVVWSSSIAVFGTAEEYGHKKVENNAHHRAQSVYGACKSLGEYLLSYYQDQYAINGTGLRFTAIYGVGRERGLSSFTTEMIRKVAFDKPYQVPFADDKIDWQFVEDVAALTIITAEAGKTKSRIFNTQGDVRPVTEGINYLRKIMPSAQLTPKPGKFGIAWEYDTTLLKEELGFVPKYTMERGILKTLNQYRLMAGKNK